MAFRRDTPYSKLEDVKMYAARLIPLAVSRVLSEYELDHLMQHHDFDVYEDRLSRGLVHTLRLYLLGNKHEDKYTEKKTYKKKVTVGANFQVPASWWQMLKRDHFPEWFTKRFPVVTTPQYYEQEQEVEFVADHTTYHSVTHVCPHANVAWPDKSHADFVIFEANNE